MENAGEPFDIKLACAAVVSATVPGAITNRGMQAMSETSGAGSHGDGDIQPLVIYNSVHHREQNAIDCADDAAMEIAAQIYNALMLVQGGISQIQARDIHPLNFGNIANSSGSLSSLLSNEMSALVNIARADAEAQQVMLQNYEILVSQQVATAIATNAELVTAFGMLDAGIREQADIMPLQRG